MFSSGYVEHPPNTDRLEVRNSLTVEFLGTAHGTILVHLFNDSTIKTRNQMHAENNQRVADDQLLAAEESRFPHLSQTAARRQAQARMIARIQALRNARGMSVIAKQTEKSNAELEYSSVLEAQLQARVAAAREDNEANDEDEPTHKQVLTATRIQQAKTRRDEVIREGYSLDQAVTLLSSTLAQAIGVSQQQAASMLRQ